MPDKSVLLVGGNGFLGGALAMRFVDAGRTVHILSRREPDSIVGAQWHAGSADDRSVVLPLLSECSTVFYLATTTTPGASAQAPVREGEENLQPLLRFMEMLPAKTPPHVVFVSSGGAIYGNPERLPVDERTPPRPLSFHAACKLASEHFLSIYARRGYPVTLLRPSNLYGPGQRLQSSFGLIRTILEHLRRNTTMEIWGDGATIRDYLYIDDAVRLCAAVADDPGADVFNVGSGTGHTIRQVCSLAEEVTGKRLALEFKSARAVDVSAIVLDSEKAQRRYRWKPAVGLWEGIEHTWRWLNARP